MPDRVLNTRWLLWAAFLGVIQTAAIAAPSAPLPVLMYEEHIQAVSTIPTDDCLAVRAYPGGNQILNEWLLLCQALRLGGIHNPIEFVPMPTQQRALRELAKGGAMLAGFTFWERDHDPSLLWQSSPTLQRGEFKKALYTNAELLPLLRQYSLMHLLEESVLVNSNWPVDDDALSCFQNRYITSTTYPNMLHMVSEGNISLMLHNLAHTEDFSHTSMGVRLEVVEGFLVTLPDSLHYLVSRNYPGSHKVLEAVNQGLDTLKAQGKLHQAYKSVAFFNSRVKDWQIIECQGGQNSLRKLASSALTSQSSL